ncbi:MAG: hypothetical protein K6F16_00045 [Lachnospiraceae bacterium]|nr:hypothetical protein [Lachnospiraceae bacterium]
MLGFVYLILSILLGFVAVNLFFPQMKFFTETDYNGQRLDLSLCFMILPVSFTFGIIVMNWISYILACMFSRSDVPLFLADEITMVFAIIAIGVGLFIIIRGRIITLGDIFSGVTPEEKFMFAAIAVLFAFLITKSFFISHGQLYVGLTVFSDFTPHVSMIRSFSVGQNFPTQYSLFAGEDVKYHFMFQFLAGNLEFLGMRLDWAFNLPSFLSVMSMFSLLYVLACKITGRRAAGIIACTLLTFRSSFSLFYYIAGLPKGTKVFRALLDNTEFIGSTQNENWGLWNLNVYINQRHLALGISVMLAIVLIFLPKLYESFERMKEEGGHIRNYFSDSLLCPEGWLPEEILPAVGAGLLLGGLGFFNGAVLLATIIVLFFIAAMSHHRLEFVITAAIAGVLAIIQEKIFVDGSAFSTSFRYGFLSDNGTASSSIYFLIKLLGFLLPLLIVYFALTDGVRRYIIIASSMLMVFAFTVSMTPDIAVNHKYIMFAVMFFDIFAADALVNMFTHEKYAMRAIAGIILLCMISTGIYDTYIISKRNNAKNSMVNNLDAPLTVWMEENCKKDDIVLTPNYYLSNSSNGSSILLSGAMLYNAWQYFAWSCGYDTSERDMIAAEIYSCRDISRLKDLIGQAGIDYIVIERANRECPDYELNEAIFENNFTAAYTEGSDIDKITVYYAK